MIVAFDHQLGSISDLANPLIEHTIRKCRNSNGGNGKKCHRQNQPVASVVTLGHGDAANQHHSDAVKQHGINDDDRKVLIPIDKSWRGQTGNT